MSPFEIIVAIILILNGHSNENYVGNNCIVQQETAAALNAQGAEIRVIFDDCSLDYIKED